MQVTQERPFDSRQLLGKFLQNPAAVLGGIPESGASAGLKEKLYALYEFLPELLREGKLEEAKILVACNRKVGQAPESLQAPQKYAELRDAAAAVVATQYAAVLPLLQSLGKVGWKVVADLCGHESLGVRQQACKALAGAGEKVVPLLLEAYENNKGPEFLKSMLTILGEVGAKNPDIVNFYKRCLHHPDAAVRKTVIASVVKLFQGEAEELLLPLLGDKDQGVLCAVVKGFETAGVKSVEAVQFVLDIASGYIKASDELFLQTVRMLRKVDAKPFNNTSLSESLNNLIGRRGLFSFASKAPKISRELELEIVMTLGKVGSWANRDKLEQLKGDKDLAMAKAAADALGEINARK